MYTLRSVLYPLYLSIPVQILRTLGLDYNCLVMNSMFFMNALIIALGDYYLYLLSKKFAGRQAAMISLVYMLFNYRMNYIFLKTLTNGVEAVFCMMGFYYYTSIKAKFDKNMALMTFAITLSFLVRSSSLIGWIPLVMIQIFRSWDWFIAVLQAGLFVTLPMCFVSVLVDSIFYGHLACPQYQFVYINVIEDITRFFGEEEPFFFLMYLEHYTVAWTTMHYFMVSYFSYFMIK